MKYYAKCIVNNDMRYQKDLVDTNKNRLIILIRKEANANRLAGNDCNWILHDENGKCVAAGGTNINGKCWRYR